MTLETFLKEKRALTKFRANFRTLRAKRMTKKQADNFITQYANNPNAIVQAFLWPDTPEGVNYWHQLDEDWVKICNNR